MLYNPVSWINDEIERNKEQQCLYLVWTVSVILLWVFWLRWNCAVTTPPPITPLPDSGHNPSAKGGVWELESSHQLTTDLKKTSSAQGCRFWLLKYLRKSEHQTQLSTYSTFLWGWIDELMSKYERKNKELNKKKIQINKKMKIGLESKAIYWQGKSNNKGLN